MTITESIAQRTGLSVEAVERMHALAGLTPCWRKPIDDELLTAGVLRLYDGWDDAIEYAWNTPELKAYLNNRGY